LSFGGWVVGVEVWVLGFWVWGYFAMIVLTFSWSNGIARREGSAATLCSVSNFSACAGLLRARRILLLVLSFPVLSVGAR